MGLHEDRIEFATELEERLETAHFKAPQAMWEATVRPWWELAADVLHRQGYTCKVDGDEPDSRHMRVWNDAIGWSEEAAAELVYTWDARQVSVTQRIAHPTDPAEIHAELPVSRLTAEKVREHLRRLIKDIKAYVTTLPEP